MSGNRLLLAALKYVDHGMAVVPTVPGSKVPISVDKTRKVLTQQNEVIAFWAAYPKAEISLATGPISGFDVLDIDKQHDGFLALEAFKRGHGALPVTACQSTPSGGFHFLWKHQNGLKNWSGGQVTAPRGFDCRTTGGLIKTSPAEGYCWKRLTPPSDLPEWPSCLASYFQKLVSPKVAYLQPRPLTVDGADKNAPYVSVVIEDYTKRIPRLPPGCQRSELNRLSFMAGKFLEAAPSVSEDEVTSALVTAGLAMSNQSGRPPWQPDDVRKIVTSGIRDGREDGPAVIPERKSKRRA